MRKALLFLGSLGMVGTLVAEPPPNLPDGPGKKTFEKVCGNCHGTEVAISRRESKDGWNAIIDDMIQRGAQASDDEFNEVSDYLAAHFSKSAPGGKINVNTSTAEEIAAGLEIPLEQAKAIVKYRDEKGLFHSPMELAKAPGMDEAKVQAKVTKLSFATR